MKRIFIIAMLFFIFPTMSFSLECSFQDRERLMKMADNVTYVVEENLDENGEFNGTFKLVFSGVCNEIYFRDSLGYSYINYRDENCGDFFTEDISGGQKYQVVISGFNTCMFEQFRTITVNLPMYNKFYDDPLCENAKEFKFCNKWGNYNISYDEFTQKVAEYKKNTQNSIIEPTTNVAKKNLVYEIYQKYYWIALVILVVMFGTLIYFWIKEQQKNKL